jgi:DNA-binding transcriptional LysR family regulator
VALTAAGRLLAGDVCVEFPSLLALVAAGRGAGIIPRLALAHAQVTVCALPPLGGRHIAAWHQAGPPPPAPATATVLDALARAAHALD